MVSAHAPSKTWNVYVWMMFFSKQQIFTQDKTGSFSTCAFRLPFSWEHSYTVSSILHKLKKSINSTGKTSTNRTLLYVHLCNCYHLKHLTHGWLVLFAVGQAITRSRWRCNWGGCSCNPQKNIPDLASGFFIDLFCMHIT